MRLSSAKDANPPKYRIFLMADLVEYYNTIRNTIRLHSAIGYITSKDKLKGRAEAVFAAREAHRARRQQSWRSGRRRQCQHGISEKLSAGYRCTMV